MTPPIDTTEIRVQDLLPGMVVEQVDGSRACFVAQAMHPVWPPLRLVIWKMGPDSKLPGGWSHDALDPRQVVGAVVEGPSAARAQAALTAGRWY